jgi:hypothetical protein
MNATDLRRRSLSILTGVVAISFATASVAGDFFTDLSLPDPNHLDASRVQLESGGYSLTPLAQPQRAKLQARNTAMATEFARAVDVISPINVALLDMPTAQDVDFSKPASGLGVPRQLARLSITLEGAQYVLWVVAVNEDREGYRHVTAKVLNHENSYAQFTIGKDRRVVGTVVTPQRSYRITPADGDAQLVYRLTKNAATARRQLLPGPAIETQKRHVQAVTAAELQPDVVTLRQRGDKLHVRGGKLGSFDARAASADNLRQVIERLGPLSNAASYGEFSITEQTRNRLRFVQLIKGVPVVARNEITLDAAGRVVDVRLSVVDPARAPTSPAIARERAMQVASRAYAAHIGAVGADVELEERPGLHYMVTVQGQPLKLQYRYAVRTSGRTGDFVTVDAIGEEVAISSALVGYWGDGFDQDVYTTTSGAPDEGEAAGTCMVHQDAQEPPFGFGIFGPCFTIDLWRTVGVLNEVDENMKNAQYTISPMPPPCCDDLGDPRPGRRRSLDVVLNTTSYPADRGPAVYHGGTYSILMRPYSGTGVNTAMNADSISHEMYHHVQDRRGYLAPETDKFGTAVREGMADAFAAANGLISAAQVASGAMDTLLAGDPWIVGDGYGGTTSGIRDIPNTLNFDHVQTHVIAGIPGWQHEAGRGISAFFRRLYEKNVMGSPTASKEYRFFRFMTDTAAELEDWDNDQLDWPDLYEAIIKAAGNDTALKNAVNQVWIEMGGAVQSGVGSGPPAPPGTPGGSGVAPAPLFVDGFFVGCNMQLHVTLHSVSWQSVPNASSYLPALNWSGIYRTYGLIPAPQTSATAYSNFNTDARIASCNGSGCSGLSVDNYVMIHSTSCSGF